MKIPAVKLSEASRIGTKRIIEASKKETSIGEQMKLANYYAFLNSFKNQKNDTENYAKILLGK